MFAFLAPAAMKLLLGRLWSNAKSGWSAIPPKAKLWILTGLAVIAAFFLHQWHSHRALNAADQAGYNRAQSEDATALAALRKRIAAAEASAATISQQLRNRSNEEARASHAAAHDLRLRGPGAASCGQLRNPAIPTAAGGSAAADRAADAAVAAVSDPGGSEIAAVPFDDTVAFSDDHDQLRIEVKAWRDWYPKMVTLWQDLARPKVPPNRR